jgi:hypothetical protein
MTANVYVYVVAGLGGFINGAQRNVKPALLCIVPLDRTAFEKTNYGLHQTPQLHKHFVSGWHLALFPFLITIVPVFLFVSQTKVPQVELG